MPKGRSKNLISLRDEKLIRRYYYWTEIQRRRFDDALAILSQEEFFLSEARIMAIIRKNCDKLTDIAVKPVPKVKMPRITARQLTLFPGE
ncbi:transposase [Parabacteroides sp. AF48-14]|uniref:transposase n=1 Tax=Parabacteroides sp. AF48-14 TaxID=2292052 RepID=UPI000F00451B|nr:transposase [Parabacteroides sp. AF48-14]RHO65702.1 transposase [Parabacteroides sp. AF48-14]